MRVPGAAHWGSGGGTGGGYGTPCTATPQGCHCSLCWAPPSPTAPLPAGAVGCSGVQWDAAGCSGGEQFASSAPSEAGGDTHTPTRVPRCEPQHLGAPCCRGTSCPPPPMLGAPSGTSAAPREQVPPPRPAGSPRAGTPRDRHGGLARPFWGHVAPPAQGRAAHPTEGHMARPARGHMAHPIWGHVARPPRGQAARPAGRGGFFGRAAGTRAAGGSGQDFTVICRTEKKQNTLFPPHFLFTPISVPKNAGERLSPEQGPALPPAPAQATAAAPHLCPCPHPAPSPQGCWSCRPPRTPGGAGTRSNK